MIGGGVFRKWPFSFKSGKKGVEMSMFLKNQHFFSLRLPLQRGKGSQTLNEGTSFRKAGVDNFETVPKLSLIHI